jgi:CO/xanthine dehydrogenase FAD-binding subunit
MPPLAQTESDGGFAPVVPDLARSYEDSRAVPQTTCAVRVAFGGLSYKPWRSADAEATLAGAPADARVLRRRWRRRAQGRAWL